MTVHVFPGPVWDRQDAFVIGGGPSLRGFDWNLLRNERVVGCNMAFRLGSDICDVVIFGDRGWWLHFKDELLRTYTGLVYTNVEELAMRPHPRVWYLPRIPIGLGVNGLAWNGHTGSSAINLALLFGASTVYMLGFDMGLDPVTGKSNWHDDVINPRAVLQSSYAKFKASWVHFYDGWKENFPDREIVNVSDICNIPDIPRIGVTEFWTQRNELRVQNHVK